jgi:hypothetical protein
MSQFHVTEIWLPPRPSAGDTAEHIAYASVQVGPLLVVGIRLNRDDAGAMFLTMPNAGRSRRVSVPRAADRAELLAAVMTAYRAKCAEAQAQRTEHVDASAESKARARH